MTTPSKLSLKKKNKQKLAPVLHDEAEEEKENISRGFSNFSDEETKSKFTTYSMSSSVIRRNAGLTNLDDQFDKFFDKVGSLQDI